MSGCRAQLLRSPSRRSFFFHGWFDQVELAPFACHNFRTLPERDGDCSAIFKALLFTGVSGVIECDGLLPPSECDLPKNSNLCIAEFRSFEQAWKVSTRRKNHMRIISFLLLLLTAQTCTAEDYWPQFLGPRGNGHTGADLPVKWTDHENVAWKTFIHDRGWSSPVE